MKNLLLIFVLLITSSLFAQNITNETNMISVDQSRGWMTKIAVDPEMRTQMMEMMIEETQGNDVEMMKLVNSMFRNPGMHKMIIDKNSESSEKIVYDLEPRGMEKVSIKMKTMHNTKSLTKKRLK
ncbi:hypothetical protein ACFLR4_02435 [Bacteroidota bacterium]